MQIKEFDIVLDIKTRDVTYQDTITKENISSIEFVREDYLTNKLNIYLQDGNIPYNLENNIVNVVFKKHDGTTVVMDAEDKNMSVEGSIVSCILSTNTIAIPNRQVHGEVIIYGQDGEKLTATATFSFRVKQPLMTDNIVKSTNEFPLLVRLISKISKLDSDIASAEEGREKLHVELLSLQKDIIASNGKMESAELERMGNEVDRIERDLARQADINLLKSTRIHKGDIEPSDTIFWYDTRKEM